MERRRLNLTPEPQQQELPLANPPLIRRRLALEPMGTVTLRVPKHVAEALKKSEGGAAALLQTTAEAFSREAHLLAELDYTKWSRERPPSSGWWDIKQISARAPAVGERCLRWWYAAPINKWCSEVPQHKDTQFVEHATFMQSHEWRGMRERWTEGYDYELEQANFAAPIHLSGDAQKVDSEPALVRLDDVPVYEDRNPIKKPLERRRINL